MGSIKTCDNIPAFTGIVGLYLIRCDQVVPTCAISLGFGANIEETDVECNNRVTVVADVTGYDVSASMNFNIVALSAVLGIDLVSVISENGITGQGLPLPIGTLPRGIGFVGVSRSDNKELHIRGVNGNLSSFEITEFARGSVVTVNLSISTSQLELIEYNGTSVTPNQSQFLSTFSPYYSWFICDCLSGDEVQTEWPDQLLGNPLFFGNTPEIAVKSTNGCCGLALTAGSGFKTDISGMLGSDGLPATQWGVIVQADLTESATILEPSPDIQAVWDDTTNLLTITNPTGPINYPFGGGPLTIGYSNDGTVIVNGETVSGLGASAAVPSSLAFMTNAPNSIVYSMNVYNRYINLSDVR